MEDNCELDEGRSAAAFGALLTTGRPVAPPGLAAGLGTSSCEVDAALDKLRPARVGAPRRRRRGGRIVRAERCSPRHELQAGGQRFWTWCVYAPSDGTVYRTYVTTARGLEPAMAYYALLDRTPRNRDESASEPLWLRRHDEYETG